MLIISKQILFNYIILVNNDNLPIVDIQIPHLNYDMQQSIPLFSLEFINLHSIYHNFYKYFKKIQFFYKLLQFVSNFSPLNLTNFYQDEYYYIIKNKKNLFNRYFL